MITVIIPVYNAERYVEEAVRSCVGLDNVTEILLVEDGSPDQALQVCQTLVERWPNVGMLRHPNGENRGAGASRNLGIAYAQGNFIAFLDADDRYLPNRFSASIEKLTEDASLDGVYGDVGTFFEEPDLKDWWVSTGRRLVTGVETEICPESLAEHLLSSDEHFHTNGVLVRRAFFEKCGVFNKQLRMCQDSDLWHRMSMVGRLAHCGDPLPVAERRVHADNRIYHHRGKRHLEWGVRMYKELLGWSRRHQPSPAVMRHLRNRYLSSSVKLAYVRGDEPGAASWRRQVCQALVNALQADWRVGMHRSFWSALADGTGVRSLLNRLSFGRSMQRETR